MEIKEIKPEEVLKDVVDWLEDEYFEYTFCAERDIVWTLQNQINFKIKKEHLPYRVISDYGLLPGKKRSFSVDLAIVDKEHPDKINKLDFVEVAVELKYEPSHKRKGTNIPACKFPVVFWDSSKGSIKKDIERINDFVSQKRARVAYSFFIDEDGHFRKRAPFPKSKWIDWENGVSVLVSQSGSSHIIF